MTWFLWALFASFCAASLAESNRIFKLEPRLLNAWRATLGAGVLAFAFPYMDWPDYRSFYIVAGVDGIVTAIGMAMFFYLAAKRTGRVSCMIIPLAAFAAYVTWWVIEPLHRPSFIEHPFRVLLAVISFTLVTLSFQKVRDNDASWDSFMIVLPVGMAFGVVDALTKQVMGASYNLYGAALAYTFLSLVCTAFCSWVVAWPKPAGGRPEGLLSSKMLWGSFWCAFWTIGMTLATVFSLCAAPNPSLTGLVMVFTPLWLFALNRMRKVHDDVSIPASILIVIGAAGLLLSTI